MKQTGNKNKQVLLSLRRDLRKNQTPAEYKLWQLIRNKQLLGHKFFRQYSINNFILDFYSPKIKLAIEIDGGQHNEPLTIKKDSERSKILKNYSITVIRFWNHDILNNIESVYEKLYQIVYNSSLPSS